MFVLVCFNPYAVTEEFAALTLAGPMIMPVHRVRVMSSSSSRPQLTVPSPSPFWPSSSSSNKRKLRGTLTPKMIQNGRRNTQDLKKEIKQSWFLN